MNQPKKNVLIYDGHCPFCTAQVHRLKSLAGGMVAAESFQERGVLNRYPGLTYEECMKEIKLINTEGKIFGGAHAIFYALSLNPFLRFLRWIYPLPLFRQIFDFGYDIVAKNRYKIRRSSRRRRQQRECPSGTCSIHNHTSKKS